VNVESLPAIDSEEEKLSDIVSCSNGCKNIVYCSEVINFFLFHYFFYFIIFFVFLIFRDVEKQIGKMDINFFVKQKKIIWKNSNNSPQKRQTNEIFGLLSKQWHF
jgi:hypothetical protein